MQNPKPRSSKSIQYFAAHFEDKIIVFTLRFMNNNQTSLE